MSKALTFKQKHELAHPKITNPTKIPPNADLLLVDVSGSMACSAFQGKTRINCVREAIAPFKGRAHVLAFDSQVEAVDCDAIPNPRGGTDLARALYHAVTLEPIHVLVMCDGGPDSNSRALEAAAQLAQQCIIDALYIGPATDTQAIAFMRELATVGHGRFSIFSLEEKSPLLLGQSVAALLALPDPSTVVKL